MLFPLLFLKNSFYIYVLFLLIKRSCKQIELKQKKMFQLDSLIDVLDF